ncbi:MAG: cytochrome c [Chloroflexota bacterium]|nr:cytochrome c [Chloroflexota bacterium]
MGRLAALLLSMLAVVLSIAACGRADKAEINQALGITPPPTVSAEQVASRESEAAAAASAQAAAASASPGTAGQAALGDVTRGDRQFLTQCSGCHSPGGRGSNLLQPGEPGASVTAETLLTVLRDGVGHSTPPGPYSASRLSDAAIRDLAAYIRSRAAP